MFSSYPSIRRTLDLIQQEERESIMQREYSRVYGGNRTSNPYGGYTSTQSLRVFRGSPESLEELGSIQTLLDRYPPTGHRSQEQQEELIINLVNLIDR